MFSVLSAVVRMATDKPDCILRGGAVEDLEVIITSPSSLISESSEEYKKSDRNPGVQLFQRKRELWLNRHVNPVPPKQVPCVASRTIGLERACPLSSPHARKKSDSKGRQF